MSAKDCCHLITAFHIWMDVQSVEWGCIQWWMCFPFWFYRWFTIEFFWKTGIIVWLLILEIHKIIV